MTVEVTTVADDLIVIHDGTTVQRLTELAADTDYVVAGQTVRTLPRPAGELLCRFATVNDVHFGEVEAGRIDDHPEGPIMRVPDGVTPYPETMNRAAVAEIRQLDPDALIVKGDLTNDGTDDEFAAFEACYREAFGDRLTVIRGNHDAYRGQQCYAGDRWLELPGVAIAALDTATPCETSGSLSAEQLDWLDAHVADSDVAVIVLGHHHQWIGVQRAPVMSPDDGPQNGDHAGDVDNTERHDVGHDDHAQRSSEYFGINPADSGALAAVIARRPQIIAYAAGHTHRHRVRRTARGVPSIEVGCVKDFPGTWAEYRVYERGVMQVVHRISRPEALAWSEQCRHLYSDFGVDYASYAMGTLADRCFVLSTQ